MIRDFQAVRELSSAVSEAAEYPIRGYREERFTDELHITDRLISAIEHRVNGIGPDYLKRHSGRRKADSRLDDLGLDEGPSRGTIVWNAVTIRAGSGSAAEESRLGANVLGVLKIESDDYPIAKGFLAQAKRAEPGVTFSATEWNRLVGQCEKMLSYSPSAFVIAYSKDQGVKFFSASAVAAFKGRDLFNLYGLSARTFFELHIESHIGDRRLKEPHVKAIDKLGEELQPEDHRSFHTLRLEGKEVK